MSFRNLFANFGEKNSLGEFLSWGTLPPRKSKTCSTRPIYVCHLRQGMIYLELRHFRFYRSLARGCHGNRRPGYVWRPIDQTSLKLVRGPSFALNTDSDNFCLSSAGSNRSQFGKRHNISKKTPSTLIYSRP